MSSETRLLIVNILALLCATWFLMLGWAWVYYINIVFVFPVAILGFFLWRKGREAEKKVLNKVAGWMLVAGVVSSLGTLIVLFFYN